MRVSDLTSYSDIDKKKLEIYTYPTEEEIKKVKVVGIYLGYYLPWDGYKNTIIAKKWLKHLNRELKDL